MRILLDAVTKQFGHVKAIDDVTLEIFDGELLALLGPSGCGKTTTLFAICGIHRIDAGRILFGDLDVSDLPAQKRNVGVVFQSFALYPHKSVSENIAFPLQVRKEAKAEIERKVDEVANLVHVRELLERRPAQLSGGQQQRVAIARAIVRRPGILLLDEPLANLDANLRLEMRSELRRLQKETGITAVIVTHDQVEAMSMSDRIAIMDDGRILQIGTPKEMYQRPRNKFVAGFIGNPPISFADGKVEDGRFVAEGLDFDLPDRIKKASVTAGQDIAVGVRPEYLQPNLATPIEGEITFIENQGREVLYDLTLAGGQVFRSIQSGEQVCTLGDRIRWGIDADAVFFFDEQGNRI
jgi:inositol-phosphate transport system ATP-binding protein